MNNPGPPDGPVFNQFHLVQNINVRVIVSRKIHFMQRIVFLFGPAALGQGNECTASSGYPIHDV